MKTQIIDMTRIWAMVTGLVLAASYFAALFLGFNMSDLLPMLVTAIGGFEMFLYSQQVWLKRKSKHG
jgi:zinc transporter ZupT